MAMLVMHNGSRFKAETGSRGSFFVTCKVSGRWLYVKGDHACRLQDSIMRGWSKFGFDADGDDVWEWIWLNCGFHRLANSGA